MAIEQISAVARILKTFSRGGLMAFIVILLVLIAGSLALAKYQGSRAMASLYIDVRHLTLNEITDIGTKASGSLVQRMAATGGRLDSTLGRVAVRTSGNGEAEWDITSNGGVMTMTVMQSSTGAGYRLSGAASRVRIAQRNTRSTGLWGFSVAMSNAICAILGVPHNAGRLLRQRKRVLRAVEAADLGH